ncbi:pyrroline-5-carboxylate reductase [Gongronella butleri]|nr:pyrroline-5-carboxylate reductase [Gongronella butleri]
MAEAIMGGLCQDPRYRLRFSEPSRERRAYMTAKYSQVEAFSDTDTMLSTGALAQVILFAVKPQVMKPVVLELGELLKHKQETQQGQQQQQPLLLSIVAGIRAITILDWLQVQVPLIRLMPNTPALIGEGAIGCYAADESVGQSHRWLTESIFKKVGKQMCWVDQEDLIDTVTGLSGSGPAYFFLIMEALQNAAVARGLSEQDAKALTMQTCLGAAQMAIQSDDDLVTLRRKVTSPKGTTEAAVKVMEELDIRKVIQDGVFAAIDRSKELADEFGN